MVLWAAERLPLTGLPKVIGNPTRVPRLLAGTKVEAELVRNVAVSVVEEFIKTVFGLAEWRNISQGVKLTVPEISVAGVVFSPHQLFCAVMVPTTVVYALPVGAVLVTMRQ